MICPLFYRRVVLYIPASQTSQNRVLPIFVIVSPDTCIINTILVPLYHYLGNH